MSEGLRVVAQRTDIPGSYSSENRPRSLALAMGRLYASIASHRRS